jgi:8-oxo-dGTP diphosphatase
MRGRALEGRGADSGGSPAGRAGSGGRAQEHHYEHDAHHAGGGGHGRVPRFCPQCGGPLGERTVERRVRPVCPACGFIWYQDPKVAACTIPSLDGRIVLVRRGITPARGLWVFPGGYMDRGETVAEAAVRETEEEAGLEVSVRDLLGVYSYADTIVVVVVYRVDVVGGVLRAGAECLEAQGFPPADIPWDELAFPSTRDALQEFLRTSGGEPRGGPCETRR